MTFRYEHNCIQVSDPSRSIAFYKNALGMRLFQRFSPPDAPELDLIFLIDDHSGHMLELAPLPDAGAHSDGVSARVHMAFVAEDMEEAHALHEAMNCICRDDPAAEVYFIADPDGYQIEIIPAHPQQRPF